MGDARGQARGDQRVHADGERDPDIDLGEAEEAAVGAHHALIVRERQHRAGSERVALQCGDRSAGWLAAGGLRQGRHSGAHGGLSHGDAYAVRCSALQNVGVLRSPSS